MIGVFEIDDYPRYKERILRICDHMYNEFPSFKVNVFAIPAEMRTMDWRDMFDRRKFVRVYQHGYCHDKGEWRKNSMDYHIWMLSHWKAGLVKAPHYGYSAEFVKACATLGFAICARNKNDLHGVKCKAWIKYNRPDNVLYAFSHPDHVPFIDTARWVRVARQCNSFKYSEEMVQ